MEIMKLAQSHCRNTMAISRIYYSGIEPNKSYLWVLAQSVTVTAQTCFYVYQANPHCILYKAWSLLGIGPFTSYMMYILAQLSKGFTKCIFYMLLLGMVAISDIIIQIQII